MTNYCSKKQFFSPVKNHKPKNVIKMGRHCYNKKNGNFVKVTVELEEKIYNKLLDIRCDYFDRRSIKEIINKALKKYLF